MNFFESWGAPKAPKNEMGPKLDENGDVIWEQPDMTGVGKPTQERPQFVERKGVPQAAEEVIAWEQPDMTDVGEPTQERPQFVERKGVPQAAEEGIAWEHPDMTGVGEITQERQQVTQDAYTAMEAVEFDPNKVAEKPGDVWEDPLANKEASKLDWDERKAA